MKVRVLPLQPHCFAFGGFELQMLATVEAARSCGVDVQPMDIWSRDGSFDVLHVWGLDIAHRPAVYWARRSGKKVVMTALLPYMSRARHARHRLSMLLGRARLAVEILQMVDVLVVVNDEQARTARDMYRVAPNRIAVIPHMVDSAYFDAGADHASDSNAPDDFVLCTGNVCPRKNQLALANACATIGYPLVIIGDALTGEDRYADALARLTQDSPLIRWVRALPAASAELIDTYRRCRVFALPSLDETQPISALEATAVGRPLMIADRQYARQKYFLNARRVEPTREASIVDGLRDVLREPGRYVAPKEHLEECRKERVGEAYKRVFERALLTSGGV